MITLGLSVLVGVLAWIATSFVGTPVRKFFDLRGEIIQRLTEFANVPAPSKDDPRPVSEFSDRDLSRLKEAHGVFRQLAAHMRAFEHEPLANWFVRWRYDPSVASAGLIGLSNSHDTYTDWETRLLYIQRIEKALRIKPP